MHKRSKLSKIKELLDFEIGFYESLLSGDPEFADALMALGEAYTRRGFHDKGLATDLRLAKLRPTHPLVWYNLACSYSLLQRPTDSLQALQQAIKLGYDDFSYVSQDPDLAPLRQSPEFKRFLESLSASHSRPS